VDNLFSAYEREARMKHAPLAVRMRPETLEDYVGQTEAVGPGSWLRAAIEHDMLTSVILYGPAGTGKTTLARIIAHTTHAEFVEVSAVTGTVKDLRREISDAEHRWLAQGKRTILFVDEIHRFSRSQQDALLHAVEDRTVVLVGATTENPYFEVNSALLSRSRVVELSLLSDDDIKQIVERAVAAPQGLDGKYVLDEDAEAEIVTLAGGDARLPSRRSSLQRSLQRLCLAKKAKARQTKALGRSHGHSSRRPILAMGRATTSRETSITTSSPPSSSR
jgi:putative ATPase